MDAHKHALFATLTPTTRSSIWSAAKDNGLGVDDVVQALLGRWDNLGEGARTMAQHLHSEHETEAMVEVMTLADTWPQPVPREGSSFTQVVPLEGGEKTGAAISVVRNLMNDAFSRVHPAPEAPPSS
jgi:hypothetical protein